MRALASLVFALAFFAPGVGGVESDDSAATAAAAAAAEDVARQMLLQEGAVSFFTIPDLSAHGLK
jgi:hypothetical protein